jgi:SAM-dependent methyltransferase
VDQPRGDRLYDDPELVAFYDIENTGRADFDYCLRLARDAASVLDIGCGTGQLAAELAETSGVTGVDPARAMLDVARGRPGGDRVEWIEADARELRLDKRFDLVLLTGHAFQVFLTDDDRAAALETIAHHLAPGGRFILDTRNPAAGEWREWTPERSRRRVKHPRLGPVKAWNDVRYDAATGVATYWTFYESRTGQVLSAESRIAFPSRESVARLIHDAGLVVDRWLGDWVGGAWTPQSPEIIPIGRLA